MTTLTLNRPVFNAGIEVKAESEKAELMDEERGLIRRARDGDKYAYQVLVERYQTRAHAIAFGVLGNYEDAQDVTQEAFVKAYRNLSTFRGQSSFYTWFYRIVFNLSVDLSRRRYRKSEIPVGDGFMLEAAAKGTSEVPPTSGKLSGPDEHYTRMEFRKKFREALANLTAEHRAVIVLREIEGLSYTEISRVVGCSKGTVMSRIHHARRRLKKALIEFWPLFGGLAEEAESEQCMAEGR